MWALFVEIAAGLAAGAVATAKEATDKGRADVALIVVVSTIVFGGALLLIPLGALRGRRRRRRWIEAVILQSVFVFSSALALVTSNHRSLAIWPFLGLTAILALLLASPVQRDAPAQDRG